MTYLLAIETSCDETAAAVLKDGRILLSNVVSSQIEVHQKYGGIVPEIAARAHAEWIHPVIQEALAQAGIHSSDLSAVGVTYGPGLIGALLVGLSAAKAIALAHNIPLIGVNHLEGHLYSCFLRKENEADFSAPSFPFLCLIVSGGHTSLVLAKNPGEYETIGQTRDDACGEAFDKVARLLGLPYPGGPAIDRLSQKGNEDAIPFPIGMKESQGYDFSYSGLKTAVANYLKKNGEAHSKEDIAASFQKAAVFTLLTKTLQVAKEKKIQNIAIVGGVSANSALRREAEKMARENSLYVFIPPLSFSTDNASMIGLAAYQKYQRGITSSLSLKAISTEKL